jgi:hypothetical protein
MLQISEDAICDAILELLEGRACFRIMMIK